DVAAYLRKLEAIQLRDQQSTPIMQLTALAGAGLNAFSAQMRDLEGDAPATQNRNQQGPDYNAIFIHILQQKQLICRDFQAITPVPAPCMLLHKAYGTYLVATVRAIGQIQAAARDATNPAAVFSALPIGQAADTAHSYADGIENQVRSRYGIPRSTGSIVP
ncbi:MAG TPA: hypothetical protein VHR86_08635, partial [Armatimonadota bacterium]|nr:hypothetical protein [Armatimonadota bacterium]